MRENKTMTTQNGGTKEWPKGPCERSIQKDIQMTDLHTNTNWLTYSQTLTDRPTHRQWLMYTQTMTDWPTHKRWLTDLHTDNDWLTYKPWLTDVHSNQNWQTYTQTMTDWRTHKPWLIYLHTNTGWLTYTQTMTAVKAHSQSQHDEEFASSVPGSFAYTGALSDAGKEFWLIMKKDMPMDYHHSAQLEYILLDKQNLKQK